MASPFRHGSSTFPEPASPVFDVGDPQARFPPYSPVATGPGATNFFIHPSRTSLLNLNGEIDIGQASSRTSLLRDDSIDMNPWESPQHDGKAYMAMPSFSRAFNMLRTAEAGRDSPTEDPVEEEIFFVPSYLQRSTYVHKLVEAYRSRVEAAESKKQSASGQKTNLASISKQPQSFPLLPTGSYRGMTHTIVERPPLFEDEDNLVPLPTKWNKDDMWPGVEIQPDGFTVKFVPIKGQFDREQDACAVRANHFMPPQCGVYYFEVKILSAKQDDTTIGIGFSAKPVPLSRPVGWEPDSWGYHGDDGRCFAGRQEGKQFGPKYNQGDTVGCGVNFRDGTAFFTKNGVKVGQYKYHGRIEARKLTVAEGTTFTDVTRNKLYPVISLKKNLEMIQANFGQSPFIYNIDDFMKDETKRIENDIQSTDTSNLVPGMNENDLAQNLVLQFLQHDGYVGAAREFAEEIRSQKAALNLDPDVEIEGINIRDDEDANNRQRIRGAILEGDIDRALKNTNAYYPQVLKDNEPVYFRLRCQKFVEMVRRAAERREKQKLKDSKKSNGNALKVGFQEMDLDVNGSENPAWVAAMEQDKSESAAELADLEIKMLEYGQSLHAEYKDDPRNEVTKALTDIWSLVAYPDPLVAPQVKHLMNKDCRASVSEELNSAIMMSLGKSSRAALETLYAQTAVLLDELRQDGGEGAFVSIEDVMEDVI
ncbi:Fc.00g099080.m01.CDS01 [Cosmosporella sp. VM-42]